MLGLLPRIGVRVLDLGSGAAVVYRRGKRTRVEFDCVMVRTEAVPKAE
jgi:hypothetical protein